MTYERPRVTLRSKGILAQVKAYAGPWTRARELYACYHLGRHPGPRWVRVALTDCHRRCDSCKRRHDVAAGEVVRDGCPYCGGCSLSWVTGQGRPAKEPECEKVRVPGAAPSSYTLSDWAIDFDRWMLEVAPRVAGDCLFYAEVEDMPHDLIAEALQVTEARVQAMLGMLKTAWGER